MRRTGVLSRGSAGALLALALAVGCQGAPTAPQPAGAPAPGPPSGPGQPPVQARAQAARAAPRATAPWQGTWTVRVWAATPADPGATALAAGLGVPLESWSGGRPVVPPGTVGVVWLPGGGDVARARQQLAPAPGAAPAGAVVVALGPGSEAWREGAATELPWAAVGVVDPVAEVGLFADPGRASVVVAGAMAARVVALHYDRPWNPLDLAQAQDLGPGLGQALGPARPDDRLAADPRVAAEAIWRQGPGPVPPMSPTGQDPPQVAVRLALAGTADFGADTHVDAFASAALLDRLAGDPDPLVRARAVDRAGVDAASKVITDPSSVVRVVAGHRLGSLAYQGRAEARAGLEAAARSGDAYVRWKAAWGLGALAGSRLVLETLLRDRDADVRRQAARSLGVLGDRQAVPALVAALDDTNSFVRRWAAEALGRLGDPAALAPLAKTAAEPTTLVAAAAARSLALLGRPTPAPAYRPPTPPRDAAEVARLAEDPDATRRKDLAKFLAGRPEDVAVLRRLRGDVDSEVRKSAVEALGWDAEAVPDLLAALADDDPDVLVTALDGLRRARAGDAPAVLAFLADPDTELRLRAAEALAAATQRSPAGSAALVRLALDPDERIRAAAVSTSPALLGPAEHSVLVLRAAVAAGALLPVGADALVQGAASGADPDLAAWGRGTLSREDDLLHLRFSWNAPDDRPAVYDALRPPVVRDYGHPDRG